MTGDYAGYHRFSERDDRNPDCFVVFRVNDEWYWQLVSYDKVPRGLPVGPFDTDSDCYINAKR